MRRNRETARRSRVSLKPRLGQHGRQTMSASITPQTVLEALLPHLTLQTSLLPTLHVQLGLPSSALEQDLATLREALVKTVDDCVHARTTEVQAWAEKCDGVEAACIALSKALGPGAKSVGATVGELRKQSVRSEFGFDGFSADMLDKQVYPRRFDLLTVQEDKLSQLYQTKLEQLHTLTARLSTISQTLGPQFYSTDILNLTPAPGASEGSDTWRDVTPDRFNRLEKELVRGKAEVVSDPTPTCNESADVGQQTRRLAHLSKTLEHISWLYAELGVPLPSLDSPIPGDEFPFPYPASPANLAASTSDPFLVVQPPDTEKQRQEYFPVFARFVARLTEAADEDLDREVIGVEGVEPSLPLMDWFERLVNDVRTVLDFGLSVV